MSFRIAGTGRCVPELRVDNFRLSEFLDTSDQWISQRTGIKERRILGGEGLNALAWQSARQALDDAGITPDMLDLIICSTLQGDYVTPSLACAVQKELGSTCPAFDINAACSGFIYALDIANAYFAAGKARHILIVCAEALSRIADWNDRSTCVLFGDGAGCVALSAGEDLLAIRLTATGNTHFLYAPVHQGNSPFSKRDSACYLKMDGQEVYKFAVTSVNEDVDAVLKISGLTPGQIDFYLLHQANTRIIESARRRIDQPEEKFPINIDRYGNTSSASIPMLLDEMNRSGRLKPGDKLLFSAFGAGMTTGACVINWSKQPNTRTAARCAAQPPCMR